MDKETEPRKRREETNIKCMDVPLGGGLLSTVDSILNCVPLSKIVVFP